MPERPVEARDGWLWRAVDAPFAGLSDVSLAEVRQLRLLALNAYATVGFGVFLLAWHAILGQWTLLALLLVFDAAMVLNLLALRVHRRWRLSGLVSSVLSLAMLLVEAQGLGGFYGSAADLLLLAPMIATLIAGYRVGLLLTVLTALAYVLLSVIPEPVAARPPQSDVLFLLFAISMFSFMAWMTWLDERSLTRLIEATRRRHATTRAEPSPSDRAARGRSGSPLRMLSASVAHEMNNPLAAARLSVAQAREGGEAVDRCLADASTALQRVGELIEQLRGHAKMARGQDSVVDLHACIDAAVGIASNELRHRAEVDIALMASSSRVAGTTADWTQAMLHLLTNAARAIPLGNAGAHRVSVATSDVPEGVRIVVVDDGEGITPEALPRVFDPFFTTREIGEGAGLGLYIVRNVVEHAGGEVRIGPGPDGVGTCVEVVVPLQRSEDAASVPSPATGHSSAA